MFTTIDPLLALVLLAAPPAAGAGPGPDAWPVRFEDVRFVDELGHIDLLRDGAVLAAGRPGKLLADFEFQSDRADERGRWRPPSLSVLWSIEDADGRSRTAEPDGGWCGLSAPAPAPFLTDFDPRTGLGRATVQIPIGTVIPHRFRHPHLWDGYSRVRVALGDEGELALDAGGEPLGARWTGAIDLACEWPEVQVDVEEPVESAGVATSVFLTLRDAPRAPRTLALEVIGTAEAELSQESVTFAPGERSAVLALTALGEGTFRVRATDSAGGAWLSRRCTALEPVFVFQVLEDAREDELRHDHSAATGGGAIPWSGGQIVPVNRVAPPRPPSYGHFKICSPAAGAGDSRTETVCGDCTIGTPTVDCPMTVYKIKPAACVFHLWSSCRKAPDVELESPPFSYVDSQIVQCGSLTVQGGPRKAPVHVGGTLTWNKKCCNYERSDGDSVSVRWPNCR